MSKHTPGPWTAMQGGQYVTDNPWSVDHEDGNDNTIAPVGGPDGQVVALVVMDDQSRPNRWGDSELDANASLISAAPDLLKALVLAVEELKQLKKTVGFRAYTIGVIDGGEEAIAKARGEA
ncbi:hypothetical protein D3C78_1535990 [compost metagenome]